MQFLSRAVQDSAIMPAASKPLGKLTRAQRSLASWAMVDDHHSLLDLSCGDGRLLEHFSDRYRVRTCGICTEPRDTKQGFERAEIISTQYGEIPWQSESFDRVFLSDANIRVAHEPGYLSEVLRVLKPGGRALFALRWMEMGDAQAGYRALLSRFHDAGFADASCRAASLGYFVLMAQKAQ